MKLIEVLKEQQDDIKELIKKILIFSLPGGEENVAIQINPSLLNLLGKNTYVLDLHVELFIETGKIRKDVFGKILRGTVETLQRRGRIPNFGNVSLRIKEVNIYKGKAKINLFNYIPAEKRDYIKKPRQIRDILFLADTAEMEENVLPTIDDDYDLTLLQREERAKNIYRFLRKGKVNNIPYVLDDYLKISVVPNYDKFNLKQNIISPHFDIYIIAPDPKILDKGALSNEDAQYDVTVALREKFVKLGIVIHFA